MPFKMKNFVFWTARLMVLVHHDDAKREYAYGAKSKIGTFSDALMAPALNFLISPRNRK